MSRILTFDWGVFWAVLAALAVGYLLFCFLARAVPTRNVLAESWLQVIKEKLDAMAEQAKLSGSEEWLYDIRTLLEYRLGVTVEEAREMNIEGAIAEEDEARRQENRMMPTKQEDSQQNANVTREQVEQHNRKMAAKYKEVLATETLAEQVERHKREITAMDARDAADAAAGLTNEHMNRIMRADMLEAHSQQRLALEKKEKEQLSKKKE